MVLSTNGLIYAAAYPQVFAWDSASGTQRWSALPDGRVSDYPGALAIGPEGNFYVATWTGLEAFNGTTGAKLWNSTARGSLAVGPDGTIYAAAHDLKAVDPETGAIKWTAVGYGAIEHIRPALAANGLIYFPGSSVLVAVDTSGQTGGWVYTEQSFGITSVIVAGDGTVLATEGSGHVLALDGVTGKRLWRLQGEGYPSDLAMSPDGSVCIAHYERIDVRDLQTGAIKRRYPLKDCEHVKLAFAEDGTLYVVARNYAQPTTQLMGLNFASGQTNWLFEPHDHEAFALTIGSDGTVYFHNGHIYAVHGDSPLANSAWPRAGQNAQNTGHWKVSGPPQITRQPRSQWAALYTSARLYFYTPVMRPLGIQWRFNGQPIAGATNESYFINSVEFHHAGTYSVIVTNEFGSVTSDDAVLSVGYALETTVVGPGTIRRVPDLEVYPTNSMVELTAIPGRANHAFVGWSGDATGTVQSLAITMGQSYAITGEFTHIFPDAKWTNDFGDAPALGTNGYLYAFSDGYITAIDTRDGHTVFYDHYFDSWWAPGAVGRDGTLYLGNYSGSSVWAHDGTTGERKGGFTVDVCVHACPAIGVDGTLYLAGRHLYAADPLVYRQFKWVFQGGNIFESSPAVGANGLVYAGCYDGKMYAINALTGARAWEFTTGGIIHSSPALSADGTVYFGSHDSNIYALNGNTGEKRWQFATDGSVPASPIIGPDGTVYIGSMDNKIYALDGATGAKRWEFVAAGGVPYTGALAADGTLYVASEIGGLYVINCQTGEKRWQLPAAGTPTIGPDGTIYAAGRAFWGNSPLANSSWPKFHATLDNNGRLPGPPVIDLRNSRFTSQGFNLSVHAEIHDTVAVEHSTNLLNWAPLTTVPNPTGRVEILDPGTNSLPTKFYRASALR